MRSLESSDRTVNMLYSILMLSNGPIFRYAKKYTKSDLCSAMSGFVAAIVIFSEKNWTKNGQCPPQKM